MSVSDPHHPEPGERLLLMCNGGPAMCRLVDYPPPLEIREREGVYVLVDRGPVTEWRYDFVADGA